VVFAQGMTIFNNILQQCLRCAIISALLIVAAPTSVQSQSLKTTVPTVLLYDVKTGSMLFDKAIDEPFPPASIIKLLTAETVFTALKDGKTSFDTEYQITEQIWRKGGAPSRGSAMFAAVNSRVKVSDLLKGLIVISGNDAALALANGIGGTEENFVTMMQERAKVIGLKNSVIRNPTGFSHPEQKVTARDILQLTQYIIDKHPEFFSLFSEREFTWNNIRQLNRNPLLAMNIGADGMKTGNTAEAGFGLVVSVMRGDRRLIAVMMGADSATARSSEARKLIDWGYDNFSERKLLERNAPLAEVSVSGGLQNSVPIGVDQELSMLLPISSQDAFETVIKTKSPLKAPILAGTEVGRLSVMSAGKIMIERPVFALSNVEQGSLSKRAFDNIKTGFWGLFRRSEPARAGAKP
jgi:serine-type D-Ala-D-Ala carboxypeptidase (penicillin-binding protein 5/6)